MKKFFTFSIHVVQANLPNGVGSIFPYNGFYIKRVNALTTGERDTNRFGYFLVHVT